MDVTSDIMPLKKGGKPDFNGKEIGRAFVEFFYKSWIEKPDNLTQYIGMNSRLQYKDNIYIGNNFIDFLKQIATNGLVVNASDCIIYDTGSRQVQILVTGTLSTPQTEPVHFSQFIMLVYMGEKNDSKWNISNSILSIT
jgi:hypothetical protein